MEADIFSDAVEISYFCFKLGIYFNKIGMKSPVEDVRPATAGKMLGA